MLRNDRFRSAQPWLSLAVRVAMATILIFAALPKLGDLAASVRAVRAYRLLPESVVPLVGNGLPVLELMLALLLLIGLKTRWLAVVWLLMMAGFTVGIIWAWSQGLQIDCGCFGGGGELAEGQTTNYPGHMLERAGFLALGAYLAVYPLSKWSADAWLAGTATPTVEKDER